MSTRFSSGKGSGEGETIDGSGGNKVFDFFALSILSEGFSFVTIDQIGLKELLDKRWNVDEGDAFIDFSGDRLGVIDSASEDDVVALDFLA